jgi:hypothetical protein
MKLIVARRPAATWAYCAELVREKYAKNFNAEVNPNPDAFVAGHSGVIAADTVSACAGITFGSDKPFFSERYLDGDIGAEIERMFGLRPDRQRIVEVGPLASRQDGAGKEIIRLTPVLTWCLGMRYILCTATEPLIKLFHLLKIPFSPLQAASRDRLLPAERERWGSYYDARPVVGVIPLNGIASLFSDITGRYSFTDPEVTVIENRAPRHVGAASEG